ncbi:flagellar basal body rod protein FlgG [Gracilaria domingensis]|nr:flagellar basal body rod protein FlgG [Gracilaria domingensis]
MQPVHDRSLRERVNDLSHIYTSLTFARTSQTTIALLKSSIRILQQTEQLAKLCERTWKQQNSGMEISNLNIAINGDGFFQIQQNDQMVYTRVGTFSLTSGGVVITSDGFELFPRVAFPPSTKSVTVTLDGSVSVIVEGATNPVHLANILLAKFRNHAALLNLGSGLFGATDDSGSAETGVPGTQGYGTIVQSSPIDSSTERLAEEIAVQRQQEMSSKIESVRSGTVPTQELGKH